MKQLNKIFEKMQISMEDFDEIYMVINVDNFVSKKYIKKVYSFSE